MRSLLVSAWLLFVQLLSCSAVHHGHKKPYQPLDCSDPEVEHAALVAQNYINGKHNHGYKFALNQIDDAKVATRRPFGEIYTLELDLLETECHVTDPASVEDCAVRPRHFHPLEGDCDVKLVKESGNFSVLQVKCKSKPESAKRFPKPCLGCPSMAPLNNTQVLEAVEVSLAQFNSPDRKYYRLLEVGRGMTQVVSGIAVHVEYAIAATNCTAQEAAAVVESCVLLTGDDAKYGFCKGKVIKPAVDKQLQVNVTCKVYDTQPGSSFAPAIHKDPSGAALPHTLLGHTYHNLQDSDFGISLLSSDSSSAEVSDVLPGAAVIVNPIAKRSVFASVKPAAPAVPPLCPGKKRFF